MSREDVIRLAREAGAHDNGWEVRFVEPCYLERFYDAAFRAGAEAERESMEGTHTCSQYCQRPACVETRKAVEAEREACARMCEAYIAEGIGREMAAAIRARGTP